MRVWICSTCGVEHATTVADCAICSDERQWVPAAGQQWTTLEQLSAAGHEVRVRPVEPELFAVTVAPTVGIGHQALLVRTSDGMLLWDPPGYVDDAAVQQVRALGDVVAVAASHPHMFGVQVEWARRLGAACVLVCQADLSWVARPDPLIRAWSGTEQVLPDLTLVQLGGHFPGSAAALWNGSDGRGALLSGDTIQTNPDRASVTFMRSYPNRVPLSAAVVRRVAGAAGALEFDRIYDNFGGAIDADARAVLRRSADRYVGWVSGEFDHLT